MCQSSRSTQRPSFFFLVQDVHVVTEDDRWEHDEEDWAIDDRNSWRWSLCCCSSRSPWCCCWRNAWCCCYSWRSSCCCCSCLWRRSSWCSPGSAAGACGGGGGDLSQLPHYLLNTTDNYHFEDLATLSHLPTPLDCISLRTLNLRLNWITSTCFFAEKTWADGWLICTLTLFQRPDP